MTDVDDMKGSKCDLFMEEIVQLRWRVLAVACFITFGCYYIFDFPGSIGTGQTHTIQAKFYNQSKEYTQEMNQDLYSVYSWPNTVLAIFGGLLIDKFLGLRRAMLLFGSLVFAGSALFYLGVVMTNFPLLLAARVVFGLGGESLFVSQGALVARWFKQGRGMALAFESWGIDTAVLFGTIMCFISVVACITIVILDIYGTKKGIVPQESRDVGEPFNWRLVKHLPLRIWLVFVVCVLAYCSIFPFIGIAKNFFQVKYGLDGGTASKYVSIYQFVCAGGSPIVGGIVDAAARNSLWVIGACGSFAGIHTMLLLTPVPAAVMMPIMGVSYSMIVSSLWPMVPLIIDETLVGVAYGFMTAMQNLGLAITPIITGAILDAYTPSGHSNNTVSSFLTETVPPSSNEAQLPTIEGFRWTEGLFILLAAVAMLVAVILTILDLSGTGILTASFNKRKQLKEEQRSLLEKKTEQVKIQNEGSDVA